MPDAEPFQLKNGQVTYDRRLDRIPSQDNRSLADYPVRSILRTEIVPVAKYWRLGPVIDQGNEGACVGFGHTADAMASPARTKIGSLAEYTKPDYIEDRDVFASSVYREAQKIDEWPGEDYDGTSVLAGAKVMQQMGIIGEYRWAASVQDIRDTIISLGPVVLGIPWFDSMYDPAASGHVSVKGELVGGHCILAYGYNPKFFIESRYQEIFRLRNSWGTTWGRNGNGFVTGADFERLMADGEGCVPLVRNARPVVPVAA